jgi:hypothetical protein
MGRIGQGGMTVSECVAPPNLHEPGRCECQKCTRDGRSGVGRAKW